MLIAFVILVVVVLVIQLIMFTVLARRMEECEDMVRLARADVNLTHDRAQKALRENAALQDQVLLDLKRYRRLPADEE